MDEFVLPVTWTAYGSETYCAAATATSVSSAEILAVIMCLIVVTFFGGDCVVDTEIDR